MAKKGLHVNVYKVPGKKFHRCDLKLNTSDGGEGLTIRGTSEDDGPVMMGSWLSSIKGKLSHAGQALAKARVIAQGILSNPALASAFPQYVAPALAALAAMEQAEKHGILPTVKKKLQDPTLKKLASEMHELSNGQRQAMSGGGICLACEDDIRARGRSNMAAMRGPRSFNYLAGMMGAAVPFSQQPAQASASPGYHDGLSMPHGGWPGSPGSLGLPTGNPHPFGSMIAQQIARGNSHDALFLQRLAAMTEAQRRKAQNDR
jgi:hypothetical protein